MSYSDKISDFDADIWVRRKFGNQGTGWTYVYVHVNQWSFIFLFFTEADHGAGRR